MTIQFTLTTPPDNIPTGEVLGGSPFFLLSESLPFIRRLRLVGRTNQLSDTPSGSDDWVRLHRGPKDEDLHFWYTFTGFAFRICDEPLTAIFGKLPRKLFVKPGPAPRRGRLQP